MTTLLVLALTQPTALDIVNAGLAAQGGRDRLASIAKTATECVAYEHMFEQSERPEGPYLQIIRDYTETADFAAAAVAVDGKMNGAVVQGWMPRKFTLDFRNNKLVPATEASDMRRRLAIGPERVLLAAASAPDLRAEKPTKLHGVLQDVVKFSWGKVPVTVFLNPVTHLLTAVETSQVGEYYWAPWGDVTYRTVYGNWSIEQGGVRFPLQWSLQRNGMVQGDVTVTKVTFTAGASTEPKALLAETAPKQEVAPVKLAAPKTIAPGIVLFPGGFQCAVVDQGDGLVMIESVVGSEYTAAVLDEVRKQFPGKPVKAVISTSDAWPHMGGLRTFVAEGIPVYLHHLTEPQARRMVAAPHTIVPDALQLKPRTANLRKVDKPVDIGTGSNRLRVVPIRGSTTERMMVVYFPEKKLLYASDTLQAMGGKFFQVHMVSELVACVKREGFDVQSAWAMHSGVIPWDRVTKAVTQAEGK